MQFRSSIIKGKLCSSIGASAARKPIRADKSRRVAEGKKKMVVRMQ